MIDEKTYMYSPFEAVRWTDDEIATEVKKLIEKYNEKADTMWTYSENIEIIANINYLYGEMVSRTENKYALTKLEADTQENQAIYTLRKKWIAENPGDKVPAMSYFEAGAEELVAKIRKEQWDLKSKLTRFKYAYDSMQEKINAIKKKQDAIKYEEWGGMNG